MSRHPSHRRLSLEPLEDRRVLAAGNVTVTVFSGKVLLQGDSGANHVVVSPLANGKLRITGAAADGGTTKINSGAYVDVPQRALFEARLASGADYLEVKGSSSRRATLQGDLSVDLGADVDKFYASYASIAGKLSLFMGSTTSAVGYESATIIQTNLGSLSYQTGRQNGSNDLSATIVKIAGNVDITGADATNGVSFASVNVGGSLTANLGSEPNSSTKSDTFAMTASTVAKKLAVYAGNGRGYVHLNTVRADAIDVAFGGNESLLWRDRFRRHFEDHD
jgi:hypothetical protein